MAEAAVWVAKLEAVAKVGAVAWVEAAAKAVAVVLLGRAVRTP
jgi:hypothetical protein